MNRWLLRRMAEQVISGQNVGTTVAGLRRKVFTVDGERKLIAIQQNPKTNSQWAKLARDGHDVVQFKDTATDKYVAVSVDGKVTEY